MERYNKELEALAASGNLRSLHHLFREGKYLYGDVFGADGKPVQMLNLSSNDYLGISCDASLREEFMGLPLTKELLFGSGSSRLITGNSMEYDGFELQLKRDYKKGGALLFNGGYHANSGVLPAIASERDLILADKLVHASIIDGITLAASYSRVRSIRFRHNDLAQLQNLIENNAGKYEKIFVVVESIYSMDGDVADLLKLVELKKSYPKANIVLYVDEAHAVGVRGENGLGLAEELGCIADIDIIVGTLGKALASMGAYIICSEELRQYLINKVRPLIFTTALPPVNIAWSCFVWDKMKQMKQQRGHLKEISELLRGAVEEMRKKVSVNSSAAGGISLLFNDTQIVPYIVGESSAAISLAEHLQREGFYVLPIRPPTVPQGTARLRFSLTANIERKEVELLAALLKNLK